MVAPERIESLQGPVRGEGLRAYVQWEDEETELEMQDWESCTLEKAAVAVQTLQRGMAGRSNRGGNEEDDLGDAAIAQEGGGVVVARAEGEVQILTRLGEVRYEVTPDGLRRTPSRLNGRETTPTGAGEP